MAYNVAKEIGALAAVLEGRIDAIVLTGGIAFDQYFVELIRRRVEFLAQLIILPGEDEMTALAQGALRVLQGEEKPETMETCRRKHMKPMRKLSEIEQPGQSPRRTPAWPWPTARTRTPSWRSSAPSRKRSSTPS